MTDIINAAPMVIDLGIQDMSRRVVPSAGLNIPQHLPLFYIFSEKGPVGRTYVDFDQTSLTQLYGDSTFDVNGKYFNHQTLSLQKAAANANNCVVHRLTGTGAKDVANTTLWLDVLPMQVPVYEKNTDGSLKMVLSVPGDASSPLVPVQEMNSGTPVTTAGYKVAWVTTTESVAIGTYQRGLKTINTAGLQTDGATQSTQYPIFEFAAKEIGEAGNRLATRLYPAKQTDIAPFPTAMLSDGKMYPFYFSMVKMVDALTGKTSPVLNGLGGSNVYFTAKQGGVNPVTGTVSDLTKVTKDLYIDLTDDIATGLGTAYTYSGNLATVLGLFYDAEKAVTDIHRDAQINATEANHFAINFLDFTSSNGSPYQALKLTTTPTSSFLPTANTNLYLKSGSDGTMDLTLLDTLVAADMANYQDPLHEYNDLVMHPESIVYDSGFTLDTKKTLLKFISRRKDTFVCLSTYAHNGVDNTVDLQYSIGTTLKTAAELYPESATFGTGVARAILVAGSGELITVPYDGRTPVLYEVLDKASNYMGASNGAWKNGFCFDKAPLSILTRLKNIDVTWVPTSTRNKMWEAGLNFVLNYKVRQQFFPALQTVYDDDTSVLNSFFTAVACSYLNKVLHAAWREFSGTISLTEAQLEEQVNSFISEAVKDKFDNKFVVIPNTKVTEKDALRGYSWTTEIQIYANGMKTVQTGFTSAFRMSDLAA